MLVQRRWDRACFDHPPPPLSLFLQGELCVVVMSGTTPRETSQGERIYSNFLLSFIQL